MLGFRTALRGPAAALAILAALVAGCDSPEPPPPPTTVATVAPSPAPVTTPAPTPPAATPEPAAYQPPHDRPGPAVDRIYFRQAQLDTAPLLVRNGEIDLYGYGLKTEAAQSLAREEGVRIYEAPSLSLSLLLNPAPAPEGQLNPFSIREVRQAINYVVNREFVAQEVYKGLAMPKFASVDSSDFDYLSVFDIVHSHGFSYDPEFARTLVARAMTDAGAQLVGGAWHYNGEAIELKFVIRTEDARRQIGDLVRVELQKLGFTVDAGYQEFSAAVSAVFSTDPQDFQWHLYTEGWGASAAGRYDYVVINQMAAPWFGNMPGWQEESFWQYAHEDLDVLGRRLYEGGFSGADERNDIYREMTRVSLDEAVRVWIVTVLSGYPATDGLRGVTEDISAGPLNSRTLREAYVPGRDSLTVGSLWVWTERSTWNPVGGFGDAYSRDIWQNLYDPTMARHPFTGLPVPFRAQYEVETAGAGGTLEVPADAVLWNADARTFRPVGPGTQAVSKVTFDYSQYLGSNWHHGQPISLADLVYSIYQTYDTVFNEEKSRIETAISSSNKPYLETIKGFRLVGDSKIEFYADYWHFVPDLIAEYSGLGGFSTPWEIRAALDQLVFVERSGAYTDTAAQRFGVDWLSLVLEQDARAVQRVLREFQEAGHFPEHAFQIGGVTLTTKEEASERYAAAIAWIEEHCTANSCTAVISSGPFTLRRFDVAAQFAELEAFRDPTYPFKPGNWHLGATQGISFANIQTAPVVAGRPAQVDVELDGPGELGILYILFDPVTREGAASGMATPTGGTSFRISLSAEETQSLQAGLFTLHMAAFSDEVASITEKRVDLEVTVG